MKRYALVREDDPSVVVNVILWDDEHPEHYAPMHVDESGVRVPCRMVECDARAQIGDPAPKGEDVTLTVRSELTRCERASLKAVARVREKTLADVEERAPDDVAVDEAVETEAAKLRGARRAALLAGDETGAKPMSEDDASKWARGALLDGAFRERVTAAVERLAAKEVVATEGKPVKGKAR